MSKTNPYREFVAIVGVLVRGAPEEDDEEEDEQEDEEERGDEVDEKGYSE
jgi:hypothetical protein